MQLIELFGRRRGRRLHCTRDYGGCRVCIGPSVCLHWVVHALGGACTGPSVCRGGRSISRRLRHRSRPLPGPLRRPLTSRLAGRHWCVGRRSRAAARASLRRASTGRSASVADGARNGAHTGARNGARGAPSSSATAATGTAATGTAATGTADGGSALRVLELSCNGRPTVGALGHLGALHDDRLGLPRRRPGGTGQLLANRRLERLSQLGASQDGAAASTGSAKGSRTRQSRTKFGLRRVTREFRRTKFGLRRVAREFRRRLPTESIGRT